MKKEEALAIRWPSSAHLSIRSVLDHAVWSYNSVRTYQDGEMAQMLDYVEETKRRRSSWTQS